MAKRDFSREAEVFRVLSDPNRLKIFATIAAADEEVCVCDLTADLPLEQPTVSHHLKVLRENGLVTSERRGTWMYYRLTPDALDILGGLIDRVASTNTRRRASKRSA